MALADLYGVATHAAKNIVNDSFVPRPRHCKINDAAVRRQCTQCGLRTRHSICAINVRNGPNGTEDQETSYYLAYVVSVLYDHIEQRLPIPKPNAGNVWPEVAGIVFAFAQS